MIRVSLRVLVSRVRSLFTGRRLDAELDEEIGTHLALLAEEHERRGLSADDARAAARRSFGGVLASAESQRLGRGLPPLDTLWQDLRYAWRGLARSPAFAVTTIATLAVGLGLVSAVFAVFNAYVLRPFAVRDPASLYEIAWRSRDAHSRVFTSRDVEALRARHDLFEDVVTESTRLVLSGDRHLTVGFVSGNYFAALGPRVLVGRAIAPFDVAAPGGAPVAVLSHPAWLRLFGGDPTIVGRRIDLNQQTLVIVGVMGPELTSLDDTPRDLWAPLPLFGPVTMQELEGETAVRALGVVARVRPGLSVPQVEQALTPLVADLAERPDGARREAVRAELVSKATPAPLSVQLLQMLSPIFAAFGLVLAAACANVSNVMLARAHARHREIGVRLAIGASRARLVRQLLTEGLLLAVLGGLAGLALAGVLLRAGVALFIAALPPPVGALVRVVSLELDHRVVLFALAGSAIATILFALAPALQATRLTLTDAMRGQAGASLRSSGLRNVFVAAQVAVSLVILVATATLLRNGAALAAVRPGLDTEGIVAIKPTSAGEGLVARAATALAADPRVAELAVASRRPFSEELRAVAVSPGAPRAIATDHAGAGSDRAAAAAAAAATVAAIRTPYTFVSPTSFSLLRIPLLRGRTFEAGEARTDAPVAIVSAAMARAFWPGQDPVGQTVRIERANGRPVDDLSGYSDVLVVGIVGDVVSGLVFEGQDPAHLYLPTSATSAHARAIVVRGRGRRELGRDTLRAPLRTVHPDPLAFDALPLEEAMALQMFPLRISAWIGYALGAVALALAISGLYGVLTYTLGQRRTEIGIRMALGATRARVVGLVMSQTAGLVGLGASIGGLIALAVMNALASVIELRNVSFIDAGAFGAGLALVTAAAAVAAWQPARRAASIDPARALRPDA